MFVEYVNISRFIDASESSQWAVMNRAMRVRNVLYRVIVAGQSKAELNETTPIAIAYLQELSHF